MVGQAQLSRKYAVTRSLDGHERGGSLSWEPIGSVTSSPSSFPRSRDRLRVLLVAEMCNPYWSSVPLVGWFHAQALRRVADVHVVTHARNTENLLKAGLDHARDFTEIPAPLLERPLIAAISAAGASVRSNKGWTTQTAASSVTYPAFERQVWRRFKARIAAGEFDVVHRLTPVSPAVPSPLAALAHRAGVPFVLGPINGGLPWPAEFLHLRVQEREWLGYVREFHKWLPAYHATRRAAAAILVGSRVALQDLPAQYREKAVYIPENAVDISRFQRSSAAPPPPPLRIAFVGRLAAIKGVDMLIEAVAPMARVGEVRLEIIGEGSEGSALKALAVRLGVEDSVNFTGWVKHDELHAHLEQCHLFAFPSVHEFGGAVVLEAMALGVVPIVVDYGGPGELVSSGTGFNIPIGSREAIIEAIRTVVSTVHQAPDALVSLAARGQQRVTSSFTWDAKAQQVLDVYRWVLGDRPKPDFGMPFRDPD